jgi:creatinine amidohydrolase
MSDELHWQGLRRDAIARLAAADATVVVPTGSVEQHGDHLPLDTDSLTAQTVALRAAEQVRSPIVVAPTVWWGVSGYWMDFPGTIAISPSTLETLLVEVVSAITAHGFRRVVLLNGHAGNSGALHGACIRLAAAGIRACALHYWSLAGADLQRLSLVDGGRIGHAGEIETSLQLHLRPEAVGPLPADGAATRMPRSVLPASAVDAVIIPPDPAAESPTGVYGDPTAGSAELGAAVFEVIVERLVAFLEAYRSTPPMSPGPRTGTAAGGGACS